VKYGPASRVPPRLRPHLAAAVGYAFVLGPVALYFSLSWNDLADFASSIDHVSVLFVDFLNFYLPAGREVFASKAPPPGLYYSAFFAILMGGLAGLSREACLAIWATAQVLAVACIFVLGARGPFAGPLGLRLVSLFLLVTSLPILHNFMWGQVSAFVVALLVGAMYAYATGRRPLAALLVSLSLTMRFSCAVFLLYFVAKRDVRTLAYAAALSAVLLGVVPALALGAEETLAYYQTVAATSRASVELWVPRNVNSQYLPHVLARWLDVPADGGAAWFVAAAYMGYAVVALNALVVAVAARRGEGPALPLSFGLLFLSTPFFVPTSWPHYFAYLPALQALACRLLLEDPAGPARAAKAAALAVSACLSGVFFFNLVDDYRTYAYQGWLFVANAILLALFQVELLRRARAPATAADGS
jgi:hypothetical protein